MTVEIDLAKWELIAVEAYLGCRAKPIPLTEKQGKDDTYPITILDGASGVGKTQQAFALMKAGYSVSYLTLCPINESSQDIYREMHKIAGKVGNEDYLEKFRTNMESFRSYVRKGQEDRDWCSLECLRRNQQEAQLKEIASCFDDLALQCPEDSSSTSWKLHGKAKNCNEDEGVLFVDEALPRTGHQDPTDACHMLRFVRNLGRLHGWRVVIAGTAATVANMIADSTPGRSPNPASRQAGDVAFGWANIIFLYTKTEASFLNITSESRPLLSQMVTNAEAQGKDTRLNYGGEWDILDGLAMSLASQKPGLNDSANKLVWLSGAWLDQSIEKPVSPFAMKSSDLVPSHFFEPAVSVINGNTSALEPCLGRGVSDFRRVSGPLSVRLLKNNTAKDVDWCVLLKADDKEQATMTNEFGRVAYFLSHCIQQCLSREPFLAVILSIASHLTREEFRDAIANVWKESATQRSAGNLLDGELFEYTAFAAVQLACRKTDTNFELRNFRGETSSVFEFLRKMYAYLAVSSCCPTDKGAMAFLDSLPENYKHPEKKPEATTMQFSIVKPIEEADSDDPKKKNIAFPLASADDKAKVVELMKSKMPWFIPSCSDPDSSPTKKAVDSLCDLLKIAALVPGANNASLDATSYQREVKWFFEFKGRNRNYSKSDGYKDLKKKCKDQGSGHALLVASTSAQSDDCSVWMDDSSGCLRILMRIGNHHKIVSSRIKTIGLDFKLKSKVSKPESNDDLELTSLLQGLTLEE